MGVVLKIRDGKNGSKTIDLSHCGKDTVSFGRSSDNDIVLKTITVSQTHGCFFKEGKEWYIQDMDSKNGIKFMRKPVTKMPLNNGAEFVINGPVKNDAEDVVIQVSVIKEAEPPVKIPPVTIGKTRDQLIRRRNEDEYTIRTIKKGCFFNLLMHDFFIRDKATLTNKRLYFYRKRGFINVRQSDGELDLQDINSVTIKRYNLVGFLVLAAASLICALVYGVQSLTDPRWYARYIKWGIGWSFFWLGIIFALTWLLTFKKFIRITYNGGHTNIGLGRFNYNEVKEFQECVMKAKEEREMLLIVDNPTENDFTGSFPSIRL